MIARLLLLLAPLLFASVSYADVTYLIGGSGDVLSESAANSINAGSIVVGHCRIGVDFRPCYWDLSEASHPLTDSGAGITAQVIDPHLVPPIGCAIASSEISDITDAGQILGHALSLEPGPCSARSNYFTGEIPAFAGWTQLADPASWAHTARLDNAQWVVTNGPGPFSSTLDLAHIDPVPEPSSLMLLALPAAALLLRKRHARS